MNHFVLKMVKATAYTLVCASLTIGLTSCDSESEKFVDEGDKLRKVEGKTYEALEKYKEAVKADPEYAKAYERIASVSKQNGDYDMAITNYEKAFEIDPDRVNLYGKIAGALIHRHSNKGDAADLAKAKETLGKAQEDRLVMRDPEMLESVKADLAALEAQIEALGGIPIKPAVDE